MTYTRNISHTAVLVVDDDPLIRDMMVDLLEIEGYQVQTARNGREALARLASQEHYLIFLDMMMPVMDGYAFCQQLLAHPKLRQQHTVILMSAIHRLSAEHLLAVDADLSKPFTVDDVLRIMQQYYPL